MSLSLSLSLSLSIYIYTYIHIHIHIHIYIYACYMWEVLNFYPDEAARFRMAVDKVRAK